MAPEAKPQPPAIEIPLSPSLLSRFGRTANLILGTRSFDPFGENRSRFVMYKTDGKRNQGWANNRLYGFLRINRSIGTESAVHLHVERSFETALHSDYTVVADIECRSDALQTLTGFRQSVQFTDHRRLHMSGLDLEESGSIANQSFVRIANGRTVRSERRLDRLTTEWAVFDAVQRLDFTPGIVLEFDMLEDMVFYRTGQRLAYMGTETHTVSGNDLPVEFHVFRQTGRGVLPYDYYLADNHRLLYVISGNLAYVADYGS